MAQHLIVPVDGSPESWRAFDVARSLAVRCGGRVRVVQVSWDPVESRETESRLQAEVHQRGPFDIDVDVEVRLAIGTVASEIDKVLGLHPGSLLVMASHGKGRSAAILGSVSEDMLQRTFGPIMLVGPNVEPDDFSGPIIVTVDGSDESESALPLAASWATRLRTSPWIINVTEPSAAQPASANVVDSAYPARLAKEVRSITRQPVQFDELHNKHPATAVPDYASHLGASLIVASSHGRSGLSRLALGSVTASFVRRATCPIMVFRLAQPHMKQAEQHNRMWAH